MGVFVFVLSWFLWMNEIHPGWRGCQRFVVNDSEYTVVLIKPQLLVDGWKTAPVKQTGYALFDLTSSLKTLKTKTEMKTRLYLIKWNLWVTSCVKDEEECWNCSLLVEYRSLSQLDWIKRWMKCLLMYHNHPWDYRLLHVSQIQTESPCLCTCPCPWTKLEFP